MTQDEKWQANWREIMDSMEANKRRPSKCIPEERGMRNWWKHQQKLMNAGELKEDRVALFKELLKWGRNTSIRISINSAGGKIWIYSEEDYGEERE